MIRKVLIANRGEIACRIIRTCHRLGVATVAVYSDADRDALHVSLAGEAIHIGPSPAAESYLRGDAVIDAALRTGADAIHPGYGFLSENPDFADAVTSAGIRFIGPSSDAIRAMGLKDAAKALMEKAGVPVVPGYHGAEQNPDLLLGEAERIGFPVLIKARAGGGGKGMRRVEEVFAFKEALASAQREASAAFGDPTCLIEKYIAHPRHIEIQVFGDDHGNVVHLFERDCSLQRRHQKVIEEAPAPGMPEDMRLAMGEAAVKAAMAISYSGAGTIEFIADASDGLKADRFWFMEMNTRLQVEHPVTEAITGVDLVEWQLRVASGEPLPRLQDELFISGWAFEARLYAEDAERGFLPATGRLAHLDLPEELARVDSGVRTGDRISPFYDPMIAKIITRGPDRQTALSLLSSALAEVRATGVTTNASFLRRLTILPDFAEGRPETGLIDRHLAELTTGQAPARETMALAALKLSGALEPKTVSDPWGRLSGFRLWSEASDFVELDYRGQHVPISFRSTVEGVYAAAVDGRQVDFGLSRLGEDTYLLEVDGRKRRFHLVPGHRDLTIFGDGESWHFGLIDPLAGEDEIAAGSDRIAAPMPGLVKLLRATPGASVTKGEALVVMEAMKMELTLAAPRDGTLADVLVSQGEQVIEGAVLLILEPEPEAGEPKDG
ncbi:Methylcrotonoyl-Coenzyme A carboxylase 1 [Neorhizobium galegae bv. officinalis bv. officinalis str. HAMBI 1141]|uniref:Methylcrotonoyl-Coenzyme A carboxylase 1 n=1 Tax=Neorhizobium galegae bv. officinalis bv. officinalis str. HAMBI 1141 TaxID=1028801 RepID=A0A068TF26_NEOGA|nr:acetyl/propionyl/methylcrotonyl-CoA carboxylase subunit alpha [Neorhizobium galegae]CDN56671.1 Methylcrotonoyl-Coenzyme A carboxylase 1 [Neorhizobium galegae bv. officinalis bv. officinalis str. HAMBI 1141]